VYFYLSARIFFIASALFILHAVARSQTHAPAPAPHSSSISGRVTIGANPAVNKRVAIREIKMNVGVSSSYLQGDESREGKAYIAVTDADGKYRVTGLHAGAYMVSVDILRSYAQASRSGRRSKQVHLDEEDERSNVDFELVRGGVITGRVTDPDGRPIIAGYVNINQADEAISDFTAGGRSYETDDRGIYRIYGLPAGRYRVSAGAPGKSWQKYAVSYHPGVTDQKQAAVIEVKEGSEAVDIDIRLSVKKKEGYDITGRVIASETGKPVTQGTIYCHGLGPARGQFRYESVDSQGDFRLTGLTPGQYALRVGPGYSSPAKEKFYSDQAIIEVTQGDVSGVEVIAKRGGAISGTVVFEDDRSTALKDRISQTIITCKISSKVGDSATSSSGAPTRVKSDGSFLLEGLPPQIVSLEVGNSAGSSPPLLLRVEKDGAAISNSIEISPGQTIAGIRLVLTNITGTIRGQVNFRGEGLPEGQRLIAFVYRNNDDSSYPSVVVDKKGRFVIEGLADGEYQVILNKRAEDGSGGSFAGSQRAQVARGSETQVTFTLDPDEGRRKN
jgi:protocatechuate 3,4-dioxygenase beta subunit